MATWHFGLHLIPRRKLGHLGICTGQVLDRDQFDSIDWWEGYHAPAACESQFDMLLPRGTTWHPSITAWGDEEGNRIELLTEHGQIQEISIRVDLRTPYDEFLDSVLHISESLDCALLTEEWRLLEPSSFQVRNAVEESSGSKFVGDPQEFLNALDDEPDGAR